jgi:hypothetical protein
LTVSDEFSSEIGAGDHIVAGNETSSFKEPEVSRRFVSRVSQRRHCAVVHDGYVDGGERSVAAGDPLPDGFMNYASPREIGGVAQESREEDRLVETRFA